MRTITVSGNLGRDPEMRSTASGTSIANFSLAVRRNRPDESGQYQSDWFSCAVFGNRASTIERYFKKGSHVVVTGDLELNEWTGNDGESHQQLAINVRDFDLPDRASSSETATQSNPTTNNEPLKSASDSIDIADDQLPF